VPGFQFHVLKWRVSRQTGLRDSRASSQLVACGVTVWLIHWRIADRSPDGTAQMVSTGCGIADRGSQVSQMTGCAVASRHVAGGPFQVTCPTPGKAWVTSEGLMGRDHPAGSLDRLRAMGRWYGGGSRGLGVRGLGHAGGVLPGAAGALAAGCCAG
jgi:hypothetical protein